MGKKSYMNQIYRTFDAGDKDGARELVKLAEAEIAGKILVAISGYYASDRALISGVLEALLKTMKKDLTASESEIEELIAQNTRFSVLTIGIDADGLREQMGGEWDGTSKEM